MRYLLSASVLALCVSTTSAADALTYTRDIKPFLEKYCVDCHNSRRAKEGVNLETLQAILKGTRRGGTLVSPGKPEQSKLYLTVSGGGGKQMPPRKYGKKPSKDEVALIKAWIADGARDGTADKDKKAEPRTEPKAEPKPTETAVAPRRRETESDR